MTHFGIVSPPVSGHLHPFGALGRELQSRGHRVSCLHVGDLRSKIESEGLESIVIGQQDHPVGTLPASLTRLSQLKGLAALNFTIGEVARTTEMVCRDAPGAIRAAGMDALLVDQMEPAGGAVAEFLGLPFVTVCNALAINRDPTVPPPFTPWPYAGHGLARWRNRGGYAASEWMTRPVARVVGGYRSRWGLAPLRSPDDSFSRLAQICQMPREFDFPRSELPSGFHYVGPLRGPSRREIGFPWDRLDPGRPLVYASLGTLQNRREPVFHCMAQACADLDVQLVLTHGGGLDESQVARMPGRPLVVSYAPQLELLSRASLTLTHAGLNTVLDSLSHGVPMVTIPLTYEQPAIARRVEHSGTGLSIELRRLTPQRLRSAITRVMQDPGFLAAARRFVPLIENAGGVRRAADLIEQVC